MPFHCQHHTRSLVAHTPVPSGRTMAYCHLVPFLIADWPSISRTGAYLWLVEPRSSSNVHAHPQQTKWVYDTLNFYEEEWVILNYRTGIQNVNLPKEMTSPTRLSHNPCIFAWLCTKWQFGVSLLMIFPQCQQQWIIIVPVVTHTTSSQGWWFRYILWVMLRCYFHFSITLHLFYHLRHIDRLLLLLITIIDNSEWWIDGDIEELYGLRDES